MPRTATRLQSRLKPLPTTTVEQVIEDDDEDDELPAIALRTSSVKRKRSSFIRNVSNDSTDEEPVKVSRSVYKRRNGSSSIENIRDDTEDDEHMKASSTAYNRIKSSSIRKISHDETEENPFKPQKGKISKGITNEPTKSNEKYQKRFEPRHRSIGNVCNDDLEDEEPQQMSRSKSVYNRHRRSSSIRDISHDDSDNHPFKPLKHKNLENTTNEDYKRKSTKKFFKKAASDRKADASFTLYEKFETPSKKLRIDENRKAMTEPRVRNRKSRITSGKRSKPMLSELSQWDYAIAKNVRSDLFLLS